MKARLNLSTKPLLTHRSFLAGAGLVGVVAAIFFVGLGWHVYSVRQANQSQRVKVAQLRQEMAGLELQRQDLEKFFAQPDNARLHERSVFLNTLIDEQSLNWTKMFMDLEKIMPAGVRLLSIEPKHDQGPVEVKITIGAMSDEAKLKFLHALEGSPAFTHVVLVAERAAAPAPGSLDRMEVELKAIYART
jgi:type IV pilus assembly protein PilN